MPLDPQARFVLDQLAAQGGLELHELTPEAARRAFAALRLPIPAEPVAHVEDRSLPGPAGAVPVRVYRSEGAATPAPGLVYFHGGGWVVGDLESHDNFCRALANRTRAVVVSVDYRLAPEHRCPAAAEDCYAATRWVAEHGAAIGVDGDAHRGRGRQRGRQPRGGRRAARARSRQSVAAPSGADLPGRGSRLRDAVVPRQRHRLPAHAREHGVVLEPLRPGRSRSAARPTHRRCAPRSSTDCRPRP